MVELTLEQIRQALNDKHDYSYVNWQKEQANDNDTGLSIIREYHSFSVDGHLFVCGEQFGGEGQGDDYWIVFSVEKDGDKKFYKIPGWYSSNYGSELEAYNTFEVKAVEKTVTVWEEVR